MWVDHFGTDIEVRTPAKLNLYFRVLGRRDDGYHEIETLMVPISLFDSLRFRATPAATEGAGAISLHCRWASPSQSSPLPETQENLVYRAIELLRHRSGAVQGATVHLVKRIPLESGLGGGSSDAAAALVAANLGWKLGWKRERLASVGAEVGSDVPFFLYGGPAICRGRGERVEPVACRGGMQAVVVKPPVGLSTKEVYARCRPGDSTGSAADLRAALSRGSLNRAAKTLRNDLQGVAAELSPWVGRLADAFSRIGCMAHQLTGSGSCYFGLFYSAAAARCAAARLAARRWGRVYIVRQIASQVRPRMSQSPC